MHKGSCGTHHQLKYSVPNRSKNQNKSHTKEPTFRNKWGLWGKEVGRMDQKQKKRMRQKERQDYKPNKRGDILKKVGYQTNSPEIPDRGETS